MNQGSPIGDVWRSVKRFSRAVERPNFRIAGIAESVAMEMFEDWEQSSAGSTPVEFYLSPDSEKRDLSFSCSELEFVLRDKKNTSPGMDGIYFSMLKHLPIRAKEILIRLYNKALFEPNIPLQGRMTKILPFLNPNYQPGNIRSYRPIALNSCVGKFLEAMVKNRVEYDLENSNWFPVEQFGFRRGKGGMECLSILCLKILKNFHLKTYTVGVFLDISGAYDSVSIYKLYENLGKANISSDLRNLILICLTGKFMLIRCAMVLLGREMCL